MPLLVASVLLSIAVATVLVIRQVFLHLNSPLRGIPGPFFARYTNLWRFFDHLEGRADLTQRILHEKYGPVVRLGPNMISLSDPEMIRVVYGARGNFKKSDFYQVSDTKVGSRIISNVFSTRNKEDHHAKRTLIASSYKFSNIIQSEPLVDDTIDAFCKQIDRQFVDEANSGNICALDKWFYFFAYDIVGQMSLSKPMGFIEAGNDFSGMVNTAGRAMDYFGVIGQMPFLDKLLAKNPIYKIGPPSWEAAAGFCFKHTMERQHGIDKRPSDKRDMLDNFLEMKKTAGIDDYGVVGSLMVNIVAGADTIGILSRAIVYYTLKNPDVLASLQHELDNARLQTPIAYEAVRNLPYLGAVIMEASRMHPGVGLMLERIVPESGLRLPDGTFLPAGTNVGMNAWVVHQNKIVFGQDAASFRPGRWLKRHSESDEEFASRLANMKRCDLTFGAGKRACLGKDVAMLETYKLMATLFLKYEIALVEPEKEWKIQNSWFIRQSGVDVKFQHRVSRPSRGEVRN